MNSLRSKRGLSVIELGSIIGIVALLFIIAVSFVAYYTHGVQRGNDKINFETASSVARINRAESVCVVTNCYGDRRCTHKTPEGSYIGYFNLVSSHIDGTPGEGYNQYNKMTVGDKVYKGKRGTMVIKVASKDNRITLSWVDAGEEE